jgi:hypothetical protein
VIGEKYSQYITDASRLWWSEVGLDLVHQEIKLAKHRGLTYITFEVWPPDSIVEMLSVEYTVKCYVNGTKRTRIFWGHHD